MDKEIIVKLLQTCAKEMEEEEDNILFPGIEGADYQGEVSMSEQDEALRLDSVIRAASSIADTASLSVDDGVHIKTQDLGMLIHYIADMLEN